MQVRSAPQYWTHSRNRRAQGRRVPWRGHGGVSPGPPSSSKRREQERAAIIHGTCRGRFPPTAPARTLLSGGAEVLACKIRFSPEIEATRNGWCAWARCGRACHSPGAPRWPCSPMRFVCTGVGSCAWGVMPSSLHEARMNRCGTSNDGAHGHGAAVGAVGAMFHVRKCAKCTVVGARATGATRTARLDNMNSGVHRVDMQIWAPRTRTPSHDTAASPSSLGVSPP